MVPFAGRTVAWVDPGEYWGFDRTGQHGDRHACRCVNRHASRHACRRAIIGAMEGYLRSDGRKGIRNVALVVYLVECAHFVAREIAQRFRGRDAQVIGFTGCYPSAYAQRVFERLCTHPNVGAVLLVSLGCEGFDRRRLRDFIAASGRAVETVVIQKTGGTAGAIAAGSAWLDATLRRARRVADRADAALRARRGNGVRRIRRHERPHGQSRDRQGVRPPRCPGGCLHVRRERRDDRLRDLHGGPRRDTRARRRDRSRRGQGGALGSRVRPWQLCAGQRGRRPHDAGREVARRLCEKRHRADRRIAAAGGGAAARRALSRRRHGGRRAAARLRAAQRFDEARRARGLRGASHAVFDRQGVGHRRRDHASPQDLRQSGRRIGN